MNRSNPDTNHNIVLKTALIRIVNDMLRALDDGNVVMVALLDLSAAFDVVDHGIFLSRMKNSQGIDGAALDWLTSYLKDRTQQVTVNGHVSKSNNLDCGFPQGSRIGPQAYKKYTEPLGTLARLLIIAFHFYADDSQLWKTANPRCPEEVSASLNRLQLAISHIADWMRKNRLKLNASKTEFLVIGSDKNRIKAQVNSIKVGDDNVMVSPSAKNLGVTIDNSLSLERHISEVVKSCRYHIRELWFICKYLSEDTAKTIVHALIISKLDYCNALYVNLPDKLTAKLQSVLHDAARLVTRTGTFRAYNPIANSSTLA